MPIRGRPRQFVIEQALDQAVETFWRHGYEGASLMDLANAMGINKPSLYAAFGDKESLFRKVVTRYAETDLGYVRDALAQPTGYDVAAALLRNNALAITRPDRPAGCLSIQGGLACGSANAGIAEFLAASRSTVEVMLADRFAKAVDEGDFPKGSSPAAMARFLSVVTEGQAVHAAAGATRDELLASVEIALQALPRPTPPPDADRQPPVA